MITFSKLKFQDPSPRVSNHGGCSEKIEKKMMAKMEVEQAHSPPQVHLLCPPTHL